MKRELAQMMNNFTYVEPISEEMTKQEQLAHFAAFESRTAQKETQSSSVCMHRRINMRKSLIIAASVAVFASVTAFTVASAVAKSRINLSGAQVHVEEREETAQNENAVFAVTLDQVLMDANGIGLLSFSIANTDGRPVNLNDIESLDVKSNVGQISYSYYYECADDTITALQIGLYTKSEPQQMTLELNGQNYLFEEIDVTESTSICWEESNAKLTPLGMSFDRTGSLNTAAESSTTATITYRDGTVEEMMVWGYGGAVDNHDAATADESRCMLELRSVRQINQADFSNYCIDLASVDSITIGDVTLFAEDGELT